MTLLEQNNVTLRLGTRLLGVTVGLPRRTIESVRTAASARIGSVAAVHAEQFLARVFGPPLP